MADPEKAAAGVHAALADYLDEGEIAISWCLVVDVAGPDDMRYLAHRAGGGADGADSPMAWAALGMLRCSAQVAEDQMRGSYTETDSEDDLRWPPFGAKAPPGRWRDRPHPRGEATRTRRPKADPIDHRGHHPGGRTLLCPNRDSARSSPPELQHPVVRRTSRTQAMLQPQRHRLHPQGRPALAPAVHRRATRRPLRIEPRSAQQLRRSHRPLPVPRLHVRDHHLRAPRPVDSEMVVARRHVDVARRPASRMAVPVSPYRPPGTQQDP